MNRQFTHDIDGIPSVLDRYDIPSDTSDTSECIDDAIVKHIQNVIMKHITTGHIENIMNYIENIIMEHITPEHIEDILKHIENTTPEHVEHITPEHIEDTTPDQIRDMIMEHIENIIIEHITEQIENIIKHIGDITPKHHKDITPEHIENITPEHIRNIIMENILKHITPEHIENIIIKHTVKHITPEHIENIISKHIMKHISTEHIPTDHIHTEHTPLAYMYLEDTEVDWECVASELSVEEKLQELQQKLRMQEILLQKQGEELKGCQDFVKKMIPIIHSFNNQLGSLQGQFHQSVTLTKHLASDIKLLRAPKSDIESDPYIWSVPGYKPSLQTVSTRHLLTDNSNWLQTLPHNRVTSMDRPISAIHRPVSAIDRPVSAMDCPVSAMDRAVSDTDRPVNATDHSVSVIGNRGLVQSSQALDIKSAAKTTAKCAHMYTSSVSVSSSSKEDQPDIY